MSFDEKSDTMDWKDETVWGLISLICGLLLALLYRYFDTFPQLGRAATLLSCSGGFYLLSIVVRILNHKGQALSGRPAFDEAKLKYLFPPLGFIIGIALLLSQR
jgi:hypothetical protein